MAFEKFVDINKKYEDKITITGSKSFGFPGKFLDENKITEELKFVVLYFDPETRRVGIQFISDPNEKHKFSLFRGRTGQGASAVATSFFGKWNIDTAISKGKYDYKVEETPQFGKMFVIELHNNKTVEITDSTSEVPPTI